MPGVFDATCHLLQNLTPLNRLQSRGTVRLILNEAKLDVDQVSKPQMTELLGQVLAQELAKRGIPEPDAVAKALLDQLRSATITDTAYDIFSKI